jgi:hypothetical protein
MMCLATRLRLRPLHMVPNGLVLPRITVNTVSLACGERSSELRLASIRENNHRAEHISDSVSELPVG